MTLGRVIVVPSVVMRHARLDVTSLDLARKALCHLTAQPAMCQRANGGLALRSNVIAARPGDRLGRTS